MNRSEHSSSPHDWQARFTAVIDGLDTVLDGGHFDATGHAGARGHRFLGWSVGRHWLLPPASDSGPGDGRHGWTRLTGRTAWTSTAI